MSGTTSGKIDQLKDLQRRLREELARGSDIALPTQEGPTWDGEKTTRLLISSLITSLQPLIAAQNPAAQADAWAQMNKINSQICALLRKVKLQASIPPISVGETPLLSDLRRWLLAQRLPISMGDRSRISADEYPPCVILPSEAPGYALAGAAALWMEGGHRRALNRPPSRDSLLDSKHVELSFDRPYVLQIGGALNPSDISELAHALAGSPQTPLIVLANSMDLVPPDLLKARPALVLPAPLQADLLGATRTVAAGEGWSLRRWWAARIDERRALLVMPQNMSARSRRQSRSIDGWELRQVLLLQVPKAGQTSLAEAEIAIRWRIDAESGLVASGGAALAWLAMQLDTTENPYAQAWQDALLVPMRQIVQNLVSNAQGQAAFTKLVDWVAEDDGPYRAYYIPQGQAGAAEPQIRRDHYLEIGSIMPLRQVERMLRQAFGATLKQLSIDSIVALSASQLHNRPLDVVSDGLKSAGNIWNLVVQEGKARIRQLQQNTTLPRFYMARPRHKPPVPAAGMYYYTEEQGALSEHVIGFDGAPRVKQDHEIGQDCVPKAQGKRVLPAAIIADLAVDDQLPRGHWVLDLGANPPAYLATCPLDAGLEPKDPPLVLRKDRLEPLDQGPGLVLPQHLRASLAHMLQHRRRQGYLTVWDNAQSGRIDYRLTQRAEPFWDMIQIVSQKLVAAIQRDLQAEPDTTTFFDNPDLVFQLNRKLSEGFIEGYAAQRLIPSGGYDPCAESLKSWGAAIRYASGSQEITYRYLRGQEKEIFDLLWQSALESRLPQVAKGRNPLTHLFSVATPGVGEAQNIVFWSMHYPHWNQDLVYALRDLAGEGLYLDDGDLQHIAEIIVESLAETHVEHLAAIAGLLARELMLPTVANLLRRLTRSAGADRQVIAPAYHLWKALVCCILTLLLGWRDKFRNACSSLWAWIRRDSIL